MSKVSQSILKFSKLLPAIILFKKRILKTLVRKKSAV